jgi:hypothetical protein
MTFVLLLAIAPSCNYLRSKGLFNKKEKEAAVLRAQRDSVRVADSLRQAQDALLAAETARQDSARQAEDDRKSLEARSRYSIIVGSFITPEYARAFAESYRKLGYDPKILQVEDSKFELVAAESHESFRKALERLKAFQDTVAFDAWMYIRK